MSLLIKDVQIVDGTGRPSYKADVLIQKNIISAIGKLKRKRAAKEIDGLGNYLAPGFIDVGNESDHYLTLFTNPAQGEFTSQGITTAIGGHGGSSLAPLLYGSLESIRKWADLTEINVDWHTVNDFLRTLERIPLEINFGTLIGHSTVRRALVGKSDGRLTTKELAVFERILRQGLREGAFGLSIGLGYVHGRLAPAKEIKTLVKIADDEGGVCTVHLRNEEEALLDSAKEILKIAKDTKAKTVVSGLRPLKGFENQFDEALKLLEKSAAGASVYFETNPNPVSARAIYTLLPLWAQKVNMETMLEVIRDKNALVQIKKDWQKLNFKEIEIVIAPHHPYLIGRKIEDADDLIRIMAATGLRATVKIPNINKEYLKKSLTMSRAFIASNGNPSTNTFPKYLEIAIKETQAPIEQAIKKITSDPASYFGLKNRGVVKERNIADLVVIGKSDYQIRHTILGGRVVGEEKTKGEILKHRR